MDIQQILVPIDYSDDSVLALQWAASLAQQFEARLILLHVIAKAVEEVYPQGNSFAVLAPAYYGGMAPGSQLGWQPIIVDLEVQAHTQLQDFAAQHLHHRLPIQVKVMVGKPADAIVRLAQEEGIDLIVMGTHGRTGVRHLLLGSVAEAVIRQVRCPVTTVRSRVEERRKVEENEALDTGAKRSVLVI
jgi:nucleotide-binding universal stress UspA family protein